MGVYRKVSHNPKLWDDVVIFEETGDGSLWLGEMNVARFTSSLRVRLPTR
jgi:hypothetical protein